MPLSHSSTTSSATSGHFFSSATSNSTSDDVLLLCGEDAGSLSDDEYVPLRRRPAPVSPFPSRGDGGDEGWEEEVVALWVGGEMEHSPGLDYRAKWSLANSLDPLVRHHSVAWILKVRAYFRFRPLTAYLAVNYMDRFLSSHRLPQTNGWPLQLLSVACLSLAAKMEETLVPCLLDLQVEDASFVFEPRTILRMELLVLSALNWRLRSITPFTFVGFFASKANPDKSYSCSLISRATQIILATIQDVDFLDYSPSSIAAASIVCAASETPLLFSSVDTTSAALWCSGLTKDGIANCYQLMQEHVANRVKQNRPEFLPRLRITSSSSSSSPSSSSNKRRKLNNCLWGDDDKERDA